VREHNAQRAFGRIDVVLYVLIKTGLAGSNLVGSGLAGNETAVTVVVGPELKAGLAGFEDRDAGARDWLAVFVDNGEVNYWKRGMLGRTRELLLAARNDSAQE
jgi:hypothetical protein